MDIQILWGENVTLKNSELKCEICFDVTDGDNNWLKIFTFESLNIEAVNEALM